MLCDFEVLMTQWTFCVIGIRLFVFAKVGWRSTTWSPLASTKLSKTYSPGLQSGGFIVTDANGSVVPFPTVKAPPVGKVGSLVSQLTLIVPGTTIVWTFKKSLPVTVAVPAARVTE